MPVKMVYCRNHIWEMCGILNRYKNVSRKKKTLIETQRNKYIKNEPCDL